MQTVINGNLDATNISASLAQSAAVNYSGQTVKGVTVNGGPGTRTNTAYGNLSDAADSVSGITVATNGLVIVLFQGTWSESVQGAASADLFVTSTELSVANGISGGQSHIPATIGGSTPTSTSVPIASMWHGLASMQGQTAVAYTGDVTTGQTVGGGIFNAGASGNLIVGGPCYIFGLPASTYTFSVQYKSTSGTVTASNRRLWVQAVSFT